MRTSRLSHCLVAITAVALATGVFAHRQYASLTTVSYNEDRGVLELAVRLEAHDLEPALRACCRLFAGLGDTSADHALVGKYVRQTFAVGYDSEPLDLAFVGAEPDANFYWAYFEAALPESFTANDAGDWSKVVFHPVFLMEYRSAQTNLITMRAGGLSGSRYFRRGDRPSALQFEPSDP